MKVLFLDIAARYLRETNMKLQCALGYNKKTCYLPLKKNGIGMMLFVILKAQNTAGCSSMLCHILFSNVY